MTKKISIWHIPQVVLVASAWTGTVVRGVCDTWDCWLDQLGCDMVECVDD